MASITGSFSRLEARRREQTPQALARLVVVGLFICLWAILLLARIPMPFPFFVVLLIETAFFLGYLRVVRWLPTVRWVDAAQWVMLTAEIVFHTTMVYFLGGISWLGAFAYVFGLIFSNTFLDLRRGAIYTTGAAAAFASLILLDATGTIPHQGYLALGPLRYSNPRFVATTMIGALGVFYSIYVWVNWVGYQLRQERDAAVRAQDGLLQARAELQRANEELEMRVRQRTAELVRVNAALLENEARLRTVVTNAPVVLFAVDAEGIFTLSEGKGLEALELQPGEAVGTSVFEMYRDNPPVVDAIRRALAGETLTAFVDVGDLWFESHFAPMLDEDGSVTGVIGIGTDITERRQATIALRRGEEMLRATIESTGDGILVLGSRGEVVHVNRRFGELWQIPEDLFETRSVRAYAEWAVTQVHNGQAIFAGMQEAFRTSEEKLDTLELTDGRLLEGYSRPLLRDGEVAGRVFSFRDVTERRHAEEALRASESMFRSMAETVAAAVFIFQGTKMQYVNSAAEQLTGYSRDELLDMDFWDVIHSDYRELVRERGMARQRGADVPRGYEVKILTKQGEARWVDFTAGVVDYEGRRAVLGTAFDITERKRAEEALREHANRDPLTGLLNRRAGRAAIRARLDAAKSEGRPFAILVLDLDRFKSINDTYSHETGDAALLQFAEVLSELTHDRGVISRLGGDEFEIGLDGYDLERATAFGDEVRAALARSLDKAGEEAARFTVSIGVACYPEDSADLVELGRLADKAMYAAKAAGANRVRAWRDIAPEQAA